MSGRKTLYRKEKYHPNIERTDEVMMKKYTVTTNEDLRLLCIKNNWFTCGSNEQYEKLFRANEGLAPIEEIATIIWICSDENQWCRRDILEELKKVHEEYLMDVGEQQIADGERAADEIYCGYFD